MLLCWSQTIVSAQKQPKLCIFVCKPIFGCWCAQTPLLSSFTSKDLSWRSVSRSTSRTPEKRFISKQFFSELAAVLPRLWTGELNPPNPNSYFPSPRNKSPPKRPGMELWDAGNYFYSFERQRYLVSRTISFPSCLRTSGHRNYRFSDISFQQRLQRVVFRCRRLAVSLTPDSTLVSCLGSMLRARNCHPGAWSDKTFI